jgi:hypothetical protein
LTATAENTVIVNAWEGERFPALSLTTMAKLNVPLIVGLPLIVPDVELSVRPGGKLPPAISQLVYG